MKELLKSAKAIQKELVLIRRRLHHTPEVGFAVEKTKEFLTEKLKELGIAAQACGKSLTAEIGQGERIFLLRADIDGLPIKEETALPFASKNGNMHACGHDLHAVMLFGAAKLLKERENGLKGRVRLLFQAAEESLEGAKNAVEHGVLDGVKGAMMAHVLTNAPLPVGKIIVASGTSAPAADYFKIVLKGKGCHGSTPWNGVDALNAAAYTVSALNGISAREIPIETPAVLTVGSLLAGQSGNVIADRAELNGTLRAFDESLRQRLKKRIAEITQGVGKTFGAKGKLTFGGGCPTLINDDSLGKLAVSVLRKGLGKDGALLSTQLDGENKSRNGGSEDFATISHKVPSIMLAVAAGERAKGYEYPLHHPKVKFDEGALSIGAFAYAAIALEYLR